MSKYIIRLDDACSTMNHANWRLVENILDEYGVKPIVGVIPNNKDSDFSWETDEHFWERVASWQEKGWTIALHGLHHKMFKCDNKQHYQLSHSRNTEFTSLPYDEQKSMLREGISILKAHGIKPICFFAPAHTYDGNTVKALCDIKDIQFIVDGYALRPYRKDGIVFLPSLCDGPFHMPVGIHTFVFHPSVMTSLKIIRLKKFLKVERENIIDARSAMSSIASKQGLIGHILERLIFFSRALRRVLYFASERAF